MLQSLLSTSPLKFKSQPRAKSPKDIVILMAKPLYSQGIVDGLALNQRTASIHVRQPATAEELLRNIQDKRPDRLYISRTLDDASGKTHSGYEFAKQLVAHYGFCSTQIVMLDPFSDLEKSYGFRRLSIPVGLHTFISDVLRAQ